ncbi:MAG: hypothetical protein ACRD12_08655 [Acidimicrobiales bacterium]
MKSVRRRCRRVVLIGALVGVCAAAGCGDGSTTGSDVPQVQGPCVTDSNVEGPWYSSVAAFEHFDSGRTHNFKCAIFTGNVQAKNDVATTPLADSYPTPYNMVVREPSESYVYGGAYGDFPGAPGSFVSKVDNTTNQQVWRTQLVDATANPSAWNYPGVVGVHRNGFVYVVYGAKLSKLDPGSGKVLATANLPYTGDVGDVAYNGFNAFTDGRIVAKTVNRQAGCTLQGFTAFLQCPDPNAVPNSIIAVVDPDSMQVVSQVQASEPIGGRLTTTEYAGVDRLYLPGSTNVFRYNWDGKTIALDPGWGPVSYLKSGQTTAPAAAVMGEWVVLQTNGLPASTPLSVVAMRQSDATVSEVQPFKSHNPKAESFLPSMITVDPENNRIFTMDAGVGKAGGFSLDPATGKMKELWTQDQRTLNFSTLIGPTDQRVFIATDVPVKTVKGLSDYTTEAIVFRNAATGKELGRSQQMPKMTSGALVTPSVDGHIYYLGLAGQISQVKVSRRGV